MDVTKVIKVAQRLHTVSQELQKRASAELAEAKTLVATATQNKEAAAKSAAAIEAKSEQLVQNLVANNWIFSKDAAEVTNRVRGANGFGETLAMFTDLASIPRPTGDEKQAHDIGSPAGGAGPITTRKQAAVLGTGRIDHDSTEAGRRFRERIMGTIG